MPDFPTEQPRRSPCFRVRKYVCGFWLLATATLFTVKVGAQWTVNAASTAGAEGAVLKAGFNGVLVGHIELSSGYPHAAIWSAINDGFVDLHPTGFSAVDTSFVFTTNGNQQAGCVIAGGKARAALWSGTSVSFVDLGPLEFGKTAINAMTASQQGGYGINELTPFRHALIWAGTSQSVMDLHPAGYVESEVQAMAASKQAGYARYSNGRRTAILWSGSSTDYVNLGFGATESSVYAMTDTLQGGVIYDPNILSEQAVLWSGTAGSRVFLGGGNSRVFAMAGDFQAGESGNQAAVWRGTSSSYENLHALVVSALGTGYTTSSVKGAYIKNGYVYLVGLAWDPIRRVSAPVVWSEPIVSFPVITQQPPSRAVLAGGVTTFYAGATGSGPISFQWRKDGVNIGGATSSTFSIISCAPGDEGVYTFVVTNAAGTATSDGATLVVNVPPVITLLPVSQTVTAGSTVSFTVAASGTPPFSYQWIKWISYPGSNTPITGATNSTFTITNVSASDAGGYEVMVTNAGGHVFSSATLNVTALIPPSDAIITITVE